MTTFRGPHDHISWTTFHGPHFVDHISWNTFHDHISWTTFRGTHFMTTFRGTHFMDHISWTTFHGTHFMTTFHGLHFWTTFHGPHFMDHISWTTFHGPHFMDHISQKKLHNPCLGLQHLTRRAFLGIASKFSPHVPWEARGAHTPHYQHHCSMFAAFSLMHVYILYFTTPYILNVTEHMLKECRRQLQTLTLNHSHNCRHFLPNATPDLM